MSEPAAVTGTVVVEGSTQLETVNGGEFVFKASTQAVQIGTVRTHGSSGNTFSTQTVIAQSAASDRNLEEVDYDSADDEFPEEPPDDGRGKPTTIYQGVIRYADGSKPKPK